jgi:hypothetical protein
MNRPADQRTHPAGTTPAGAPMVALDYDEIEDTTPSTPYPGRRLVALRRWLARSWSWVLSLFGVTKRG